MIVESLLYLILLSFIGSVAGLVGGIILLFKKEWAKKLAHVSVPLAAGVLLSISFLDLFPEAVDEAGQVAFSIVLVVFIVFFLVERFLLYLHHHVEEGEKHAGHSHSNEVAIPLIIFGDTIHNFLDGVAIGTSFLVNPSFGLVVAFSTFLHETPHEIADFGILLAKGWARQKVFLANLLTSLATFPGAILSFLFADDLKMGTGLLMALAAGFFLYVAATDFLPEATHAPRKYLGEQALFLLIGVAGILLLRSLVPEIGH